METRKLQEVGGGTYTVSIPKEWATTHGFEAGTAVNLYTHLDGSVVVRSREKDGGELDAVRIDTSGQGIDRVRRRVEAALAVGFETVTLVREESFTVDERRAVDSLVRGLVGTEVVGEGDERITVRNLLDASDVSVRQSVVQLQFVALAMHRRATASLAGGETETEGAYEQLCERETEAERLFRMVARQFSRALVSLEEIDRLGLTRPELFDYYETARHLRGVATESVETARAATRLSAPLPDERAAELAEIATATRTVVEDASNAILGGRDARAIHRMFERHREIHDDIDRFDEALTDASAPSFAGSVGDAVTMARVLDSHARTLEHGGRIADVAVRAVTRSEA